MLLPGLTVVLVDAAIDPKWNRDVELALEAMTMAKPMRIFAVSDRLIEYQHVPEAFGFFPGESRIAQAVNRINILRPARVLIVTGVVRESFGALRDGTHGFVWHAQQELVPRSGVTPGWRLLFASPAEIPGEMHRIEKEKADGAEQTSVR